MSLFIDTSAFYALLDDQDPNHARARAAFEGLRIADRLLTHEYIAVETMTLVQRRLGMAVLRRFVHDLLPIADLEWVDQGLHLEAREVVLASGVRDVSLVDRVSFIFMRRRGIQAAFAFDEDFAREGFRTIPA